MKSLSEGKILIVEDARIYRMILRDALKQDHGFCIAENGESAEGYVLKSLSQDFDNIITWLFKQPAKYL